MAWAAPGAVPSVGSAPAAHAGGTHGAGASRAAESARAGAAGAADDLQICSGALPAGIPGVPAAAPLPPSQARQPRGLGMAAASASPRPPPPFLPDRNRRRTHLRSHRWVSQARGCCRTLQSIQGAAGAALRGPGAAAVPATGAAHTSEQGQAVRGCWAVNMDSTDGWVCRPGVTWEPHASPQPSLWVQLTPFVQGGQASCVRAKGLIKYLADN